MSAPDIVDIQRVTLNAVQRIHDFCQANGLRYYLIGGGLIGAIRHGGPIPWDDDIDIGMNRPGFRRHLAAINYGLGGGGYEYETLHG